MRVFFPIISLTSSSFATTMTDVLELANTYISIDPHEDTRNEVRALVDAKDILALEKLLLSRMEFGTAGLRAPMGAGYTRMNGLTLLQTSQGLARYLIECFGEGAKEMGVVIGFDHRATEVENQGAGNAAASTLSSRQFCRQCAAVFLHSGFKVYLLEDLVPTPFVAFGVTHLKCCCGIMVTASHNPRKDNGFKVYWDNGAQIIPPHDGGISRHIEENLTPWLIKEGGYDVSDAGVLGHARAENATERVSAAYYEVLMTLQGKEATSTRASGVKVAYTAMHGVGGKWIKKAFSLFHPNSLEAGGALQLLCVPNQYEPDPMFPTVSFPNPEEKGALDASMAYAAENGCDFIVANDPDADRLAVAEWDASTGAWKVFSGNNLGVLLAHWQIMQYKQKKRTSAPADKGPAVLTTVVSSRMLKAVAAAEGVTYSDTLTGFKWIGNRALEMTKEGYAVLFSYEEALGYCTGNKLCDKDGISAACVFVEMKLALAGHADGPKTVREHLLSLYAQYGEFVSYNSYVFCHDKQLTKQIFARLRQGAGEGGYWTECAGEKIVSVHDITRGYDSTAENKASALPATPESEMLMFEFGNSVSVTLRTSGTEPKIKFYTEVQGQAGDTTAALTEKLTAFVEGVIEEMLQWRVHSLARP